MTTDRDVLRRVLETGGRCRAEIWLQNRKTTEWYCWDSCTRDPGHELPHRIESARDGATWVEWGPDALSSLQVDLAGAETRPSPWTPDEIAILRSVMPASPPAKDG